MVFSSLIFLYLFLPAVLLLYFLLLERCRIAVLLAFSLVFYGFGEPAYLVIMLASITANFIFGAYIGKNKLSSPHKTKIVLALSVALNLAVLCFFKYTDFFIENIALLPGLTGKLRPLGIALPLGISLYTFQSMSYAIDVYRDDAQVQKSCTKFALYVSFFPQLIAGPIVRYKTIAAQLDSREENWEKRRSGLVRFMVGLAKKVLLANSFGQLWDFFSAMPAGERSLLGAWLGAAAFTMQIYFDFGGYSDMAIGLGRLFGFSFSENFQYPYLSKSITEFWGKRWHISLGTWFKEYLYIPLGGNRCTIPRHIFNLCIVWLLTGFWHGASWNFVLWGAYYAVLLVLEKYLLLKWLKRAPAWLSTLYSLFFVMIGWVIFSLNSFAEIAAYMRSMFVFAAPGFIDDTVRYVLSGWTPLLLIGVAACTPAGAMLMRRLRVRSERIYTLAEAVLCVAALVVCTAYIVDANYNPFLYFRF